MGWGGRGDWRGGGGGQLTARGSALPTSISPNWCTCTLNVQKFGFANLAHYDFFFFILVAIITKYAVQCSAVQPNAVQCSAVRCGLV